MSDDDLRVAAMAANPDHPWYDHNDLGDALVPLTDVGDDAWADAAFIAAASPAVVLALLERVRVAEALTGHPARSGGAEAADGGRVALGATDDLPGAEIREMVRRINETAALLAAITETPDDEREVRG